MRKVGIILLVFFIMLLTAVGLTNGKGGGQVRDEYIRIHIRADSDDPQAQAVKYAVRDRLVTEIAPIIAECNSFEQAADTLKSAESHLSKVGTDTLAELGFAYDARAVVRREFFPTRFYEGYTLPAGEYLALIVELGRAEGQNWWCVIYPPLCLAGQSGVPVRYKSRILEMIDAWKNG